MTLHCKNKLSKKNIHNNDDIKTERKKSLYIFFSYFSTKQNFESNIFEKNLTIKNKVNFTKGNQ